MMKNDYDEFDDEAQKTPPPEVERSASPPEVTPEELDQLLLGDFSENKVEHLQQHLKTFAQTRAPSSAEVEYLLAQYPFLQLLNDACKAEDELPTVRFVTAKLSSWVIHDYGDALAASPGRFLFGAMGASPKEGGKGEVGAGDAGGDGGSGSGRGGATGRGTVVKQAFDTAVAMMELAREKGWARVHVVAGHRLMQWAAWVAADTLGGIELLGFFPTKEEYERKVRVQRAPEELEKIKIQIRRPR